MRGIVWLTGLPGAGKTTIAEALAAHLAAPGCWPCVLDGDRLRQGLCRELGFSPADRAENVRRVAEVACLVAASGGVAIVALVSPYAADRAAARRSAGTLPFFEVHVHAELAVCEARDPKGLYAKARAGLLTGLTGFDAPYEEPLSPALRLDTGHCTVAEAVERIAGLCASARPTEGPTQL